MHYRYKLLQEQSENAFKELNNFDDKVNTALSKISVGVERNDIGKLSWGGADLVDLYAIMEKQKELWTDDQFQEIKEHIKKVRDQTREGFKQWLSRLTVARIEHLERFKHINSQIASSLKKLNLLEEQEQLEAFVEEVDKNIKLITKINNVVSDVENMVHRNYITDNTPVSVLNKWLEQAAELEKHLEMASQKKGLLETKIDKATQVLSAFKEQCKKQLSHYKERMQRVFDIQTLSNSSDIEYWRREIAALKVIYSGQERDVEDLSQVIKQLDLIELHLNKLSDYDLSTEEFAATCGRCMEETGRYFCDDAPPLDYEKIYDNLKKEITQRRENAANEWFLRNVPEVSSIATLEASNVLQIKIALLTAPRILTKEQAEIVDQALAACEKRLDELELEGLLAKFKELSPNLDEPVP